MLQNLNERMLKMYVEKRENLKETIDRVLRNNRGAGAVEYALVIGVVVVMIIGAAAVMDKPIRNLFKSAIQAVQDLIK
jgi:Flp pilus assembly pilin Flp